MRPRSSDLLSVHTQGITWYGSLHTDFKRWYADIGKAIASNTHTLESVKVSVLSGGRYQTDIVGVRQAESRKGEYIVFRFRQQWTLVDGPGKQPLILTCLVEAAK